MPMAFTRPSFSRKTIAIAVAAGMSLTGVSVAASQTTDSGFGAAVANAQAAKPGVTTSDVSYLGIFNKDNTKLSSPFSSASYFGRENKGTLLDVKDGSELRAEFSLANANPGDNLRITPRTEFNLPNGKDASSSVVGVRISSTSEWSNIEHEGVVIGKYRYMKSGSLEVEFNNAVADVKSGKVTLAAPVMVWDWYGSAEENGVTGDWDGNKVSTSVSGTSQAIAMARPKDGEEKTSKIGTIGTANFSVITSGSTRGDARFYDSGSLITDTENFTVRRPITRLELPAGANGTFEVTPDVDNPKSADWYFADNLTFTPEILEYGKAGADDQYRYTALTWEEAQKKYSGLKVEGTKQGRGVKVTTSGVPENVKVRVLVRGGKGESGNSYATYVENAGMHAKGSFKGTINDKPVERNLINVVDVMVPIPGLPSVSGLENVKRSGELSGAIASQPAGVGVTGDPAPVGGTKQTFQFFVKNTGDAPLVAPIVTLPNGKKVNVKDVAIKPGTEGSFSVDYDVPAGDGSLNFDVSLSKAELKPSSTVTFRYVDKSKDTQAKQQETLDKIAEDLKKQNEALDKQSKELQGVKDQLKKSNELTEETNKKLQDQIDATKDQTKKIEAQLKQLNDVEKRELEEMIRQSKALEKTNEILLNQYREQLKQWKIENDFAKDEQDDRHHSSKLGRCISTDPALPLMILIPAGLAAAFNVPGMDSLAKSAGEQIGRMNMDIQRATGINNAIPADIQSAINSFNHNYGDALTTGAITIGGLAAAVGAAIGINNLMNNCFDEADDEVGRKRTPHTPLEDSAVLPREGENGESGSSIEGSSSDEGSAEAETEDKSAEDTEAPAEAPADEAVAAE